MLELSSPQTLIEWLGLTGTLLSALIVIFLPAEIWRRWRAGQLSRAVVLEMLASASPLFPTLLLGGLVLAFIGTLYAFSAQWAPWRIPTNAWTAVIAVLLVDFLYYWDHRSAHRFRPYWAIAHSVHHSSSQYDQTIGLRISFVDGFISPWFYVPAVLVGFDPLLVLAALGLILGYQQWIHTETIGKLRWFDGWLNSPANHRVHHGVQAQYIDKNFGAVLIIWDRWFGTYEPEVEHVQYGLSKPIGSSHPWQVHTKELARLLTDLGQARDWPQWWRRLNFMPKA